MLKIQAGEKPQRPSDGILDPVWDFLEKCWSSKPAKRPLVAQIHGTFSKPRSASQILRIPEGRLAMEELPGKLKLQAQSIRISLSKRKKQRFSVRFKYGNEGHTTSPTAKVSAGDEHTWFVLRSSHPSYCHSPFCRNGPETWSIETHEQHHGQMVSLEVLCHSKAVFKKAKVCATGSFSVSSQPLGNRRRHLSPMRSFSITSTGRSS